MRIRYPAGFEGGKVTLHVDNIHYHGDEYHGDERGETAECLPRGDDSDYSAIFGGVLDPAVAGGP